MPRLLMVLLALITVVGAIWLYPFDADGPFSMHDGIWYGINAESKPKEAIIGHHPLFHVAALGLVALLRMGHVDAPGHVAIRILAGAGGAALLWGLFRIAGPRPWIGLGLALVLACSRSFIVEAAVGENVLPACAAALWCLTLAAKDGPRWKSVGVTFVLALLLRQDNILLLPGLLVMLAPRAAKGDALGRLVVWTLGVGIVTAAAYVTIWWLGTLPKTGLFDWLFRLGAVNWSAPDSMRSLGAALSHHAEALTIAAVGRHWSWDPDAMVPASSLAVLIPTVTLGFLFRGSDPWRRLLVGLAITLLVRVPFYVWFEAHNPEWHVFTLASILAAVAAVSRGMPATSLPARATGAALVLAAAGTLLTFHGSATWQLRERRLMSAVESVVSEGRGRWRFIAHGHALAAGFSMLHVKRDVLEGSLDGAMLANAVAKAQQNAAPTLFMTDRFVIDGMPWTVENLPRLPVDDPAFAAAPGTRIFRRDGLVYAILFGAAGAESR